MSSHRPSPPALPHPSAVHAACLISPRSGSVSCAHRRQREERGTAGGGGEHLGDRGWGKEKRWRRKTTVGVSGGRAAGVGG